MKRNLCILTLMPFLCISGLAAQEADPAIPPAEPDAQISEQDPEEAPLENVFPGFRNQALVLDINARVIEQDMLEIWNETHQRVTIPGRPVGIKMVGSNVIVAAQFIPYLRRRGQNILVAQGQIWLDIPNQGIRYQTTMQTIPLNFDEPVYFFPLGSGKQTNYARIEIMLTMKPYRDSPVTDTGIPEENQGENDNQGSNAP